MDLRAFYLIFIPGFTVLATLIGIAIAVMAMSVNISSPRDDGDTPAH